MIPLDQRAQRVRDLVGAARTCIIEIGRELIKAKAECDYGEWLPWLKAEFGWSRQTADRYMAVAIAFQTAHAEQFSALYALSAPDVPAEARAAAIELAEAGERVTKDKADEMGRQAKDAKAAELDATFRKTWRSMRGSHSSALIWRLPGPRKRCTTAACAGVPPLCN